MKACFEVHNALGPCFSERIYENALAIELELKGIIVERQKWIEVLYKNRKVGKYKLDVVIEGKVLLELKARMDLDKVFQAQVFSYLKASGLKLGVQVNFGRPRVEYKRVVF
ncbi:MAG: GxxExxY protein [Bacteroidota bacterium]